MKADDIICLGEAYSLQTYAQVLYALEAIAAYERARGIKADYSRSDHRHDAEQSGTSNSAPLTAHEFAKPAASPARGAVDETAALRSETVEALPEWAKPGKRVRYYGATPHRVTSRDAVVVAVDRGRILLGDGMPSARPMLWVVDSPSYGGWWPVDDKGNPLGAEPRKVTTSAEVDAGMASLGVSTKSADIGLAKEAVAELCNEYLRHGEDRPGGVARAGDSVAVNQKDFAHPPEVIAKAESATDALETLMNNGNGGQ